MQISILIAEDDPLLRRLLHEILAVQEGFEVVGNVGEGTAVISAITELKPQVVLLDLHLPGLSGMQVLERPPETELQARVLVLSGYEEHETQLQAARAGACGFVPKSRATSELADAIRKVAAGGVWFTPAIVEAMLNDYRELLRRAPRPENPLDRLSPREREVLACMARGMTNLEIGAELHTGVSTVKSHVGRILHKLGVPNRTEAAVFAVSHGVRESPDS